MPSAASCPAIASVRWSRAGTCAWRPRSTPDQIQPASLDLRLGRRAWRVRASFLPGRDVAVHQRLDALALHEIDLAPGAVLETGCVYIVELLERLALPPAVAAAANPKSSTGRLDVFTRVIADGMRAFDQIPAGYHGPLYLEISPRTFPILVRTGSRLSQLRFRLGSAVLTDDELARAAGRAAPRRHAEPDLDPERHRGVDRPRRPARRRRRLPRQAPHRPRRRRPARRPATCSTSGSRSARAARSSLILDPDEFYILASKEAVHVPPAYAAEMTPFDPLVGEFRVHYAGFFDPGFGHAAAGGAGAARGAGGALARRAVHPGGRPDRRPPGL